MHRSLAFAAGAAVVAASIAGIFGASQLGTSSRGPGPSAGKPRVAGVVLLSIDTLRADALESLESDATGGPAMPSLLALAKQGVRFSGALAPSSWTAPSLASAMTGVVPLRHGVIDPSESNHLPAAVKTVASLLKDAGWSTWASTGGGWASAVAGLEAGFDRFGEDFDDAPPAVAVGRWSAERPKDRPFFLWLHTYVAHDPYGGKDGLRTPRCADEVEAGRAIGARLASADPAVAAAAQRDVVLARLASPCRRQGLESGQFPGGYVSIVQRLSRFVNGGWRDDPDDAAAVATLPGLYRGALRSIADRRVRETLEALAAAAPMGDAAVIVLGDHGEGFGEHGVLSHGTRVTEEMTRIPLVLRAPGLAPGTTVDVSCGVVDVMPTVLEFAGLPVPEGLDGRSLLALAGSGGLSGRPIVSSIVATAQWSEAVGEPQCFRVALRDEETAWLGRYDVAKAAWVEDEWFDRRGDPHEQSALATPPSDAARPPFSDARTTLRSQVERRSHAYRR